MLVNGKWTADWHPVQATDDKGGFVRQVSGLRNWITPDGAAGPTGEGGFKAEAGRYHLYVALICPWASRTLIARTLKGLEQLVSVSVVAPELTDQGWRFGGYPGADLDNLNGASYMHEIYTRADPHYTGRATVPVLWDKQRQTIVNNESADILRMLNSGFGELADPGFDLYPQDLRAEIDALNERIYPRLNNGVYRAGFATTQEAYEEAFDELFRELEWVERRLGKQRYLTGECLTEADWRLFTTAVRFDAVYFGHFKCNLRRIEDYPNLSNWLRELYQWPGIAETVDFTHIKSHYYASHRQINGNGIIPKGPALGLHRPHDRERLPGRGIWTRHLSTATHV
jgi:putative glutathione S-transferase